MRIVIVGAGAVGSYLAERLSSEGQDIVLIESDAARAAELQTELDVLVVVGNGASPRTLAEAEVERADLLIAVTSSDATNILAAHAATRLGVESRIARVEDPMLLEEAEELGVDLLIDPGEAVAKELVRTINSGGISEAIDFADGRLQLFGGFIGPGSAAAHLTLSRLRSMIEGWTWVVVAVIRGHETLIARGATELLPGDHVLIMTEAGKAHDAFEIFGWREEPFNKVIILGSTRLARRTAMLLCEEGINTTLIDQDADRVRSVATNNPRVIAVHGDPTDPKVLRSEGVENTDAVLALTGWDEINILGCLVAKALGASKTVSRFHRFDLVSILPGVGIDSGVSARLAAANDILRFVRRGSIYSVVTFRDSDAEAIELQVEPGSPAVGKTFAEIHLPHEMIVGGIIRGEEVFVPVGKSTIEADDHLIVIALPEAFPELEKLSG
ncbi:MAG: Trk system potassium transporter TrkA [bacterium]|nr:Trk system potassium transporter TrkA [bacterium]